MLYIGYRYESACGAEINKIVLCKDENEYRRVKERIEHVGYEVIEFDEVVKARVVL